MEQEKGPKIVLSGPMTDDQIAKLEAKSVQAFELLSEVSECLDMIGVVMLQTTISIRIPGIEYPKIVVLAHPDLEPGDLRELLEVLGKDAEFCVHQAQAVVGLAIERATDGSDEEGLSMCEDCLENDDCDHVIKETIH